MVISKHLSVMFSLSLLLAGCTSSPPNDTAAVREEILQTEHAFARMADVEGIGKAFIAFAADEAILIRNSKAIEGKEAIMEYFAQRPDSGQTLSWEPRKIEVAASGDLAYSFGDFTYTRTDGSGERQVLEGNFCTIWKRQPDGSWKYVMD